MILPSLRVALTIAATSLGRTRPYQMTAPLGSPITTLPAHLWPPKCEHLKRPTTSGRGLP